MICGMEMGQLVAADVDLKDSNVKKVEVLPMPELSDEEKEEAINIAKDDPEVKKLLDEGAEIGMVFPTITITIIKGEVEPQSTKMVKVEIKHGEKMYLAHVDLDEKEVVRLTEPIVLSSIYKSPKVTPRPAPALTDEKKAEAIRIAKADPRVEKLLEEGATMGEVFGRLTVGLVKSEESEGGNIFTVSSPSMVKALVQLEQGEKRWSVHVNMKKKEVTEVIPMPMPPPALTEAENEEAINIAKADSRVKELLDKGATIGKVSPMFSFGVRVDETGKTPECAETLARVEIELGEKSWIAEVDLSEGKVVRVIETNSGNTPIPFGADEESEYGTVEYGTVEEE